jgi:tetratricopeptide (TPR) repeat protein
VGKGARRRQSHEQSGHEQSGRNERPLVAKADRGRPLRAHILRLLAIWGLLLIAYSNSFQSGLVFDNASIIGRDVRIRQASSHNIEAIFSGGYRPNNPTDGLYRPLTTFTYLVNYAVLGDGEQPAGYHWFNLSLQALNIVLVYVLGIAIFGETALAWAVAAIWGLHPLLTESVTNIVGRADLLAAFGVLSGLLCYLRSASSTGWKRAAWLAGVAAAQAIGLFSKESAAVLPGLMLAHDLIWSGRAGWRQRAAGYAALALPFAAYFYLREQAHPRLLVGFAENPLVHAGFWTARFTAVKVIGKLLWLFVWPARLSADYSYNAIPLFGWNLSNWEDAQALLAIGICLGAIALGLLLAFRRRKAGKPALFLLLFFFIAAAPTSNFVFLIGSIMAERFLYLPSVGLAGLLVMGAVALSRRLPPRYATPRVGFLAAGALCLALAVRTYARNADWKDELSLWSSAVDVCPNSGKAHYNLGQALDHVPGGLPNAIAEYQTALRIDPNDAEAHTNLGNALAATGRLPEAIAEYQAAVRIHPESAEPHNDLGNVLATIPGRFAEAIAEYQAALRLEPGNSELHYNFANALLREPGRLADAIAEYQAALRLDPDHADAHANLAKALSTVPGRQPDATAEYRAALRINPDLVNAHINLANLLSGIPDRLAEAVGEYRAALRIQPDNGEAHYDLATALERTPGGLQEAIAEYQAAVRIAPDFMEAHVNLGNALAEIPGKKADAMAEYEAALRIRPDPVVRQMLEKLRAQR